MQFGKMGARGGFGSLGLLGGAKGGPVTLPKFKAALARQASGGAVARIQILGHSHIAGEGAGTGTLGLLNCSPLGWVQKLSSNLSPKIIADCHSFFGDQNAPVSNSVPSGVTFQQMDPRVVWGAPPSWQDDTATSTLGGRFIVAPFTSDTSQLVFTPGYTFSSAKFWYPTAAGLSNNVGVFVNGVQQTTVNQNAANGYTSVTLNVPGTSISLLNNQATGSTTAYCHGFECFRASQQAVISYSGWLGAQASDIATVGSPYSPLPAATAYNADLLIVQCMINDINASNPVATWAATMNTLLSTLTASHAMDVIIVIDPACSGANFIGGGSLYSQYIAAAATLAATYNGIVVNMQNALGATWAIANAAGLMFDANHPDATGHGLCSQLVANTVLHGLGLI